MRGPAAPGQVVALTHAFFETVEQAQAAAQQNAPLLTADVPNDTDIQPESYMAQIKAHPLGTRAYMPRRSLAR